MRKLMITALVAVSANVAFAQVNHEALVNLPAGGTGGIAGQHLSQLEANETVFGFGAQSTANNIMADDFTLTSDLLVTSITLYTYQTSATSPSITAASWAIGSTASTTLDATSPVSVAWMSQGGLAVYRVSSTSTSDANRRIQEVTVDVPDFTLTAGTYFLSYNFAGTLSSGPWSPPNPTSTSNYGHNGMQSVGGGAFAQVWQDTAQTMGADLPFKINGDPVPEPATMAVLGLGAAALIRRRKKA